MEMRFNFWVKSATLTHQQESSLCILIRYSRPLYLLRAKSHGECQEGNIYDLGIGLIQENYHFTSWWEPNLPLNVEQLSNRFSKSSPTQDLSSQNSPATIMCWFSLSLSAESGATRKWREARSWLVKTRQHWASSGSLLSSMLSSMTRWSPLQHPHPHLHLHHQVTSKEVNRPCSVREELNSNLALAGVLWGLVKILRSSGIL